MAGLRTAGSAGRASACSPHLVCCAICAACVCGAQWTPALSGRPPALHGHLKVGVPRLASPWSRPTVPPPRPAAAPQRLRIMEFTLDHEAPYFTNMRRRTSRKVGGAGTRGGAAPRLAAAPTPGRAGRGRVPTAGRSPRWVVPAGGAPPQSSAPTKPLPPCRPPAPSISVAPACDTCARLPDPSRQHRCVVPRALPSQDSDLNGVVDVRYTGGARMLLLIEVGTGRWRIKIPVMVSGEAAPPAPPEALRWRRLLPTLVKRAGRIAGWLLLACAGLLHQSLELPPSAEPRRPAMSTEPAVPCLHPTHTHTHTSPLPPLQTWIWRASCG